MKRYKAFGLIIESELPFDELSPCDAEKADIAIAMGKVPEASENLILDTPNVKIGRDRYWSDIRDIAKFYVENGESILFEPARNASFEEIKLYVLGSCMGAALYQRRILPLHGSCVSVNGKGILLTGEPGAGKSTVAAVMYQKGYKILSDDVTAIVLPEPGIPVACPGYPSQKLWKDAIERLGVKEEKNVLNRISNDLYKYSVRNPAYFDDNSVPLKAIAEILPSDTACLRLEQIKGAGKLEAVLRNTYRRILAEAMELREWHFGQSLSVAEKAAVYRIIRPKDKYLENEIADLILEKVL
jgi:hypothetical protein